MGGRDANGRQRRGWLIAALILVILGALAIAVVFVSGIWLMMTRPSDPWAAQVVSVDTSTVCTVSYEGEKDGGFVQPFCVSAEGEGSDLALLRPGDCVLANAHHPAFVIERRIPCPAGRSLRTTTTR